MRTGVYAVVAGDGGAGRGDDGRQCEREWKGDGWGMRLGMRMGFKLRLGLGLRLDSGGGRG